VIPHPAVPWRFSQGTLVVNEQDSSEEIVNAIEVITRFPLGWRIELPEFGMPDQTFAQGHLDLDLIRETLARWEPRAATLVDEDDSQLAQSIIAATITTVLTREA